MISIYLHLAIQVHHTYILENCKLHGHLQYPYVFFRINFEFETYHRGIDEIEVIRTDVLFYRNIARVKTHI